MTRTRKSRRWLGLLLLALLIVALGFGYTHYVRPMLRVATGYTAKMVCSEHFVAGFTVEQVLRDLPDNPLVPYLRVQVDEANGLATATLWGWLEGQTAIYRPNLGCTLLAGPGPYATAPLELPPAAAPNPDAPWPYGEASTIRNTAAGSDIPALAQALERAFAEPDPARPRHTRAVLVAWRGQLVGERYAEGITPQTPLLGWSMTKSVTSALVGIYLARQGIQVTDPAPAPEWRARPDDPRQAITWEHLLRMTSGLDFREDYADLRADVLQMLYNTGDMGAYTARRPLAQPPGTWWNYTSGSTNLLARLVRLGFGGDPEELAAYWRFPYETLFWPLGMHTAVLEPDASGSWVGSSYMYASARDWARFGLLYLQDGVWDGQQILPPGWVAFSTQVTAASGGEYGAHWWLNRGTADDPNARPWPDLPEDAFAALGHDGQAVLVIPSREVVIVRLGLSRYDTWDLNELGRDVLEALVK